MGSSFGHAVGDVDPDRVDQLGCEPGFLPVPDDVFLYLFDWPVGLSSADGYFPTGRFHATISPACEVHNLVRACGDYLELIDQDWCRLADWYHLPAQQRHGVSPEQLYGKFRNQRRS